jgi:hypothetical protein
MLNTEKEIKRWTVIDSFTNKIHDITDNDFNCGIITNMIKLRGRFITVENGHKIWIDGIVVK